MIKYVFRDDVLTIKNAAKADPQQIGEALAKIAKENGELKPQFVIKAAEASRHPLHKYFEWDDAKAAHQHRMEQARQLIRSVDIVDKSKGKPRSLRAFLSIADNGNTSYRTVQDVMNSEALQVVVMRQAERDLVAFELRYKQLDEICDIVRAAREKVHKQIVATESRV